MKFPFDFSIKLVFRLIFPGIILAAAMFPATDAALAAIGLANRPAYTYPFEVVAWGWMIAICDMHIYMLYEGRRYWPYPLRKLFVRLQEARLGCLRKIAFPKLAEGLAPLPNWANRLCNILWGSDTECLPNWAKGLSNFLSGPNTDRRRAEASVEYAQYPSNDCGDAYVKYPTRLGNLILSYEDYPELKYGLNLMFYWPRLWMLIDKDLREEVDNAQSLVDSTVYVSFAFYVSGIIMFLYAVIGKIQSRIHLPFVPEAHVLACMGVACLIAGFLIYRLSLPAHYTFGELIKSLFDVHRGKLDLSDVVAMVSRYTGDKTIMRKSRKERNRIAWAYLCWHRYSIDGSEPTPRQWEELQKRTNEPAAAGEPDNVFPPSASAGQSGIDRSDHAKTLISQEHIP